MNSWISYYKNLFPKFCPLKGPSNKDLGDTGPLGPRLWPWKAIFHKMRQVEIWTLTVYWMILGTMPNFWSGVNWYLWLCFSKNNLCFRDSYWNTVYKVISCLGFVSRSSLGYWELGGGVDEAGLAMSWQYWSCLMGPVGSYIFSVSLYMFENLPGGIWRKSY